MVDKVRVVIAEDEAIIRLDLKEILTEEGYLVVGDTARGDHALELVAEHEPDVVILDIKMPGLDGIETARRIAENHDAAVVILTAFSQRELVDDNGDGNLEADSTIWFQIQMIGLGGFGGQVDSLLERSIPGYRRQYD